MTAKTTSLRPDDDTCRPFAPSFHFSGECEENGDLHLYMERADRAFESTREIDVLIDRLIERRKQLYARQQAKAAAK